MPARIINSYVAETGGELVSLEEAKEFCYVDFDDQDNQFLTFISAARRHIEKRTSRSLIEKNVITNIDVVFRTGPISKNVPFAPIAEIRSVSYKACPFAQSKDITGGDYYTVIGESEPAVVFNKAGLYTLTYTAGYTENNLPADLKTAWLQLIAAMYENRGEINGEKALIAENLIRPFIRTTWLG